MGEKTSSFGAKSRHRVIFDFAKHPTFPRHCPGKADSKVTFGPSLQPRANAAHWCAAGGPQERFRIAAPLRRVQAESAAAGADLHGGITA